MPIVIDVEHTRTDKENVEIFFETMKDPKSGKMLSVDVVEDPKSETLINVEQPQGNMKE